MKISNNTPVLDYKIDNTGKKHCFSLMFLTDENILTIESSLQKEKFRIRSILLDKEEAIDNNFLYQCMIKKYNDIKLLIKVLKGK